MAQQAEERRVLRVQLGGPNQMIQRFVVLASFQQERAHGHMDRRILGVERGQVGIPALGLAHVGQFQIRTLGQQHFPAVGQGIARRLQDGQGRVAVTPVLFQVGDGHVERGRLNCPGCAQFQRGPGLVVVAQQPPQFGGAQVVAALVRLQGDGLLVGGDGGA